MKRHDLLIRMIIVFNVLLITAVFILCWEWSYGDNLWRRAFYGRGNYVVFAMFLVLYSVFGRTYDAFEISLHPVSEMVYSQTLAAFFANFIMYGVICLLSRHLVTIIPLLICFAGQIFLSVVWCVFVHRWYFHRYPPRKTYIIYDMRQDMESLISEYGMEKKFRVIGSCSASECLAANMSMITPELQAVYMCGVHSHERNIILKKCIEMGITVYVNPRIGDLIMSGARKMHMYHLPILQVRRYVPTPEYAIVKRFCDILLSSLALILLSPVMTVTALLIRSDGGPALYKQTRLTKDGKEFKILKFRSMRVDAEKDGVARLSSGDHDDRITKVGKVIRAIRFDELPQLINILKGDMSIVGPRPERPEIAKQYEEELPEFRLRLQVRAGLTGYAQVYGKYNTTPYDKLQMDLMYIARPGFVEDIKICFATVKILFMKESTEGVENGAVLAGDKSAEERKKDSSAL